MRLTIAVSTLVVNLERALSIFDNISDCSGLDLLVVCQGADRSYEEWCTNKKNCKIRIAYCDSTGLSKSRNKVLQLVTSGFIWFLDDDVEIDDKAVHKIFRLGASTQAAVILGRISCSDCEGMYKKYGSPRAGLLGALRASSIEVIVDRDFIRRKKLVFDERLGLGAKYPSGEENAFLLQIIKKGGQIIEIDSSIVKHPCLQAVREPAKLWADHRVMIAKGILASNAGLFGIIIMLYLALKVLVVTRSLSALYFVPKGFVLGLSGK